MKLIKDDEFRSLFTFEFILIFWLKALYSNSDIFSVLDRNSSKIFLVELKEFRLNVEVLIENESFNLKSDQVIGNNWNSIAVRLKYDNYSSISIVIDKITLNLESLSKAPLIESNASDYFIGFDPNLNSNKSFMGFIYKLEFFRFYSNLIDLNFEDFIYCGTENQSCIVNCDNFEYFNESLGRCMNCSNYCDDGCRKYGKCGMCIDDNCEKCGSFGMRSCKSCENGFVLDAGNCLSCENLNKSQSCLKCFDVCKNCFSSQICTECNSKWKGSDQCLCSIGFSIIDGKCSRNFFSLFIKISEVNDITLVFSENLLNELSQNDFSLLNDNHTLSKSISYNNSSIYTVRLLDSNLNSDPIITLVFSNQMISSKNSILQNKTYSFRLYPTSSLSKQEPLSLIQNLTMIGNSITVGISFSLGILSLDLSNFFNFLNVIELLSILSLFKLRIPDQTTELLISLRVQKSMPNTIKNFIVPPSTNQIQADYIRYGYDSSSILINSGNNFVAFASISFAFLIQKVVLSRFIHKFQKLALIKEYFEYNIFLKYWIQTSFEFMVTCTYGISLVKLDNWFAIFDFSICCIALVIYS